MTLLGHQLTVRTRVARTYRRHRARCAQGGAARWEGLRSLPARGRRTAGAGSVVRPSQSPSSHTCRPLVAACRGVGSRPVGSYTDAEIQMAGVRGVDPSARTQLPPAARCGVPGPVLDL